MKRCTKGKSCGATCITKPDRCVLELGPLVSASLTKVRSKLGVVKMYYQVRDQKVKGGQAKFERIRKDLANEIGGRLDKTKDLIELKNRLQKEGLLPKTKGGKELSDIFARSTEAGKPARAPSLPQDLKNALAGLWKAPDAAPAAATTPSERYRRRVAQAEENERQGKKPPVVEGRKAERSPGQETKTPMNVLQRGSLDRQLDDISRILRGESAEFIRTEGSNDWRADLGLKLSSNPNTSATGNTRWARGDAKDFDTDLGKVRREGSKSYNGWEDSYASGARKIGEGSYGTVIRNPDGTFVKRGAISDTEAGLIRRLGEVDLGPRLRAADINGKHPDMAENFVDVRNGRIAMSQVPGKPMGATTAADKQFGGKTAADIYWKALADLHRMGIAHNDAHIDNILVDDKGKGRWVDLGLAQASPKAALAEAMGIFNTLPGAEATRGSGAAGQGNWQTRRWAGTGTREAEAARRGGAQTWVEFQRRFPVASAVWENRPDAQYKLMKMGLSKSDISTIIDHGIRSTPESYNQGVWSKLTDAQAQEVLNTLYNGI